MSTTEKFGDVEISLELEPFVTEDDNNKCGDFSIAIDIEQTDGSIQPEFVQGTWAVAEDARYIFIENLQKPNTVLGSLQRRVARLNGLRLVDDKLMRKTWESLSETQEIKGKGDKNG